MLFHPRWVTLMLQTQESNKRSPRLVVINILTNLPAIFTLAFADVSVVLH